MTQLLEDLNRYHQLLQQDCDRIIILLPPIYTGYDRQLASAMQCLGYNREQFKFIIVQPFKLYAFHKPSQQVQPIRDILPRELLKAVSLNALKWYGFSVPLTSVAPLNISPVGQAKDSDRYHRISNFWRKCSHLLQEVQGQNTIPEVSLKTLDRESWESPLANQLVDLLNATPQILQQSAGEFALHLICKHVEMLCDSGDRWLEIFNSTSENDLLLATTHKTLQDLLVNILGLQF
ncbi:MAG: hypothetical protein AAGA60_18125 [Cyanobacteria bacterium P01_E01_bin.42]